MKQVIVVRKDLNMRTGKLAAQVAHASMKVLLDVALQGFAHRLGANDFQFRVLNPGSFDPALLINLTPEMRVWLEGSFTKIVVGVNSEEEFLAIKDRADEAGVVNAAIKDLGQTEFHGVPTWTALALGPDTPAKLDPITGHLKLL